MVRKLLTKTALVSGLFVVALMSACSQNRSAQVQDDSTTTTQTAATSPTGTTGTSVNDTGKINIADLMGDWIIDTIRVSRTVIRSGETTYTDTSAAYSNDSLFIDITVDSTYISALRTLQAVAGTIGRGTYGNTGTTQNFANQITHDTGTWSLSGTTLKLLSNRTANGTSALASSVKYLDSLKSVVADTFHIDTVGLTSAQLRQMLDSLKVPYDTMRYPRSTVAYQPSNNRYLDSMKTILADSFHIDTAGLTGTALTDTLDSLHLGIPQRTTQYTDSIRTGFGITTTGTTSYSIVLTSNRILFSVVSGQSVAGGMFGGGSSTTVYSAHKKQ